jgi:hypothetical protein
VEFLPDCGHAVPTDAPWGTTRVSPSTVSNLNKKIHGQIEAWRNQPIEGELDADRLSPIFGSTYAGGTIEELGAASLELTLLRRIWRPKHRPLHVPIRY